MCRRVNGKLEICNEFRIALAREIIAREEFKEARLQMAWLRSNGHGKNVQ